MPLASINSKHKTIMHIQKITFTLLFVVAALAGNAQENKKKTHGSEQNTTAAPAPAVQETPQKGAPIPTSANTPQKPASPAAQPAPPSAAPQPMQAVPQTTTNGDQPVDADKLKQPKDRTLKRNLKAKNASGDVKK